MWKARTVQVSKRRASPKSPRPWSDIFVINPLAETRRINNTLFSAFLWVVSHYLSKSEKNRLKICTPQKKALILHSLLKRTLQERWQSGLMHRSWKPTYREVPGVRIPLSPPPNFLQVANPYRVSDFLLARVPKGFEFLGTLWGRKMPILSSIRQQGSLLPCGDL